MWVHELVGADARCGGKALGLARLLAAGLPVPPGFVLDDRAFRHAAGDLPVDDRDALGHALAAAAERIATLELPPELEREVRTRAAKLGTVAVRSSATIEDGHAGAAAGVFSSRTAVPAAEVWAAIRAVWTSALAPLAAAYARRRGGTISIGVIVQHHVPGPASTVYTRPPGAPTGEELLVQQGSGLVRLLRSSIRDGTARDDAMTRDAIAAVDAAHLALRSEVALGITTGADVEIVGDHVVQARPIIHPPARVRRTSAPPTVTALLATDGRRWTWDIAHNPDPLSTAQAELVERVDQAGVAPYALRVCAGFLYSSPRRGSAPPSTEHLVERVREIESRLAIVLGATETASLDDALARYLAFYAIWSTELAPLIAAAKIGASAGTRPSSVEATLLAAARDELDEPAALDRLGVMSPAWDVAVPTYAERPEIVRDAIARARIVAGRLASPASSSHDAVADLAERDDHWFARAQWLVRRALLARGAELGLDDNDVFWLPFTALADGIAPDDARRRAAAARTAAARAARWEMPIVLGEEIIPPGEPLHGVGSGPRVSGRVVRFASLASTVTVGAGHVVVARAVTPALAVMVIGCAALVSETGGFLDHGAAMARELGITCVVGCKDAWSLLDDGMLVTVEGDAGLVTPSS